MEEENCSMTPDDFARRLSTPQTDLIVLDVRPFTNFSQSHLLSSINVCLPSSLVKRKSFSLTNVEATISCETSREKLKKRIGAYVVLYDSDCEKVKKNCVLSSLIQKFQEEKQVLGVSYLLGGFQSFCQKFPQLCTSGIKLANPCSFSLSLPRAFISAPPNDLDRPCVEPVEIFDYLYVGDQDIASNATTLGKFRLTYILNTAKECPNFFEGNPLYHYLRLDLLDSATQNLDMSLLELSFQYIDEARAKNERVLVHCRAGQSRSATIVIAYLIRTYRWTLQEAYRFVQEKRPAISPNLGFMAQLTQFEKCILGITSNVHTLINPSTNNHTNNNISSEVNTPPANGLAIVPPNTPNNAKFNLLPTTIINPASLLPTPSHTPNNVINYELPIFGSKSENAGPLTPLSPPFETNVNEYALVCK